MTESDNSFSNPDVSVSFATEQLTCQSKTYRQIKKKDGGTSMKWDPDDLQSTNEPIFDADSSYALVIRRYISEKDEPQPVDLRINSPLILKAFRDVIKSYPTIAADFMTPIELKSPFQILLHYWDQLDAYRIETNSSHIRQHLNLLFQFMKQEMGIEREVYESMLRKQMITFKQAWIIYAPGELIYTEVLGKPWLLRVSKVSYETSRNMGPFMTVHAQYCDVDDNKIGEAHTTFRILQRDHFASDHPANILTLPVYPLRLHKQRENLQEELLIRGKKCIGNRGLVTRDYDGLAQYLKEPAYDYYHTEMASFPAVWLPFTETGRIILDRKTFDEENNNSSIMIHEVDDPELILLPPYLVGYSMDRKEWCRYLVDNIRDVTWRPNAWSSLILESGQKSVLEALVQSHKYPNNARNHLEQKGKGLVVLLHGSPGSGKTMSAEAAAEMSKKALLPTSMSELNKYDSPWMFERSLQKLLQLATIWKVIVLFDEADVFLESRKSKSSDATRNALVAVFLKHLEYFSGIVFLTTNRIASIDEAMMSRVHLSIHFDLPDIGTRRSIWRLNLESVPKDETEIGQQEATDQVIEELMRFKLNGREISNALNTARTLARFERAKLNISYVKRVLEVSERFNLHVKEKETRPETADMDGFN